VISLLVMTIDDYPVVGQQSARHSRGMRPTEDAAVLAMHDQLVRGGLLRPIALGAEEQDWMDCELAAFAEHRLGDRTCPRELDPTRRETWRTRATDEPLWAPSLRIELERCFWILEGGRRVGTVALATSRLGGKSARLSSLYVYPVHRGRGIGRRAVERIRDQLHDHGTVLRLETDWTWQPALRLYLRIGLTVHGWKRAVEFRSNPTGTPPEVVFDGSRATVTTKGPGDRPLVVEAERDGDRLVLRGAVGPSEPIAWAGLSTLAVTLALQGWPLIRSPEHWERSRGSDLGPPEALAYKITIWEAWARKHGWRVDTRPVPGLEYPSWEALEARWQEAEQAYHLASRRPPTS
jgi:GNAT superfamily N-acetyltransferase